MARIGESWPQALDVFGETWQVKLVSKRALRGAWGDYNAERKTIRVWMVLKGRARWRVLFHEIVHIIFAHGNGQKGVPIGIEEAFIDGLITGVEVGLYEVLNRNFGVGPRERGEE
jgi:hypothetical protein